MQLKKGCFNAFQSNNMYTVQNIKHYVVYLPKEVFILHAVQNISG